MRNKGCVGKAYPGFAFGTCHRPVVVERDGKSYCRIHDPEHIKILRDKRRVKRSQNEIS